MPGPDIYAVTGAPIFHSLSPVLFAAAFRETGLDAIYTRLAVDDAEEAIRIARQIGLRGMNVTAPLKEQIIPLLDECDPVARKIGAANTVVIDGNTARGFNTDPAGVSAMLEAACADLKCRSVAVLGAGGAARAATYTLVEEGVREVVVVNRSQQRGKGTAEGFGCRYTSWDKAPEEFAEADAIFSCLPTMVAPLDPTWLRPGQLLLDANYKSPRLAEVALQAGCVYGGGRAWLLGQAVEAFRVLTGTEAPAAAMERALIASVKPSRPRRFVLCGMMGTAKSTVGKALAAELGVPFLDTNRMVERAAGASVPEVFRQLGEPEFRRMEARAVAEAMDTERAVVAVGGGALLDPESRARVRRRASAVWLWADPETAARRAGGATRPLLSGSDPVGAARELLEARLPTYAACSDLIVDTASRTPEVVARKITDEIRQTWPG